MKPWLHLLLICLLFQMAAFSQQKSAQLSGVVTDSLKKGVPQVTVSLQKKAAQGSPIIAATNAQGRFQVKTDTGAYQVTITHTGFAPIQFPLQLKEGQQDLDSIVLSMTPHSMQHITVTARKALIEQTGDRIIYNVENDPAAKTESASELLRKAPLVTVDGDGNVQVNGQSNFKVLLNGRETSMFALNVKDALKNFPGAIISKIEVITSPSAKYDAEGIGGIINIITKKKVVGYNIYLHSYFSTLSNYSENASFNIKSGKLGISGNVGTNGTLHHIRSFNTSETTPADPTAFTKRTLDGERRNRSSGGFGNLELVYDIDSFKTVAAYGNIGRFTGTGALHQDIVTRFTSGPSQTSLFIQDNRSVSPNSGLGADFIRRYRGKPEKEFSLRFNGQFSRNNSFINSQQDNPVQDRYVANESRSVNREYTVQADVIQPIAPGKKLETGVKAILRNASSDFRSLVKYNSTEAYRPDPRNADQFNYHQEVYSGYVSYNFTLRQSNFRAGLRGEYTHVEGDFQSSKTGVKQSYANLIPNLMVSRKYSPLYTLTANYNMRLQRPSITSLNPFVNNNDSLNISYGNPDLGPQVLHAVSVQNRFTKGKMFAAITLNASYTNSMIVSFAEYEAAKGITRTTSANVGREFQAGFQGFMNTPVGEKLNLGFSGGLRYNKIENKSDLLQKREGISGAIFTNFQYRPFGKFTLSGSGGVIQNPYALTNTPAMNYFYQVNFGYKFFEDKLAVTMNVNNFHSRYMLFESETVTPALQIIHTNRSPYRVIYFGITYQLGKLKEQVSKKKGVNNDDLVN